MQYNTLRVDFFSDGSREFLIMLNNSPVEWTMYEQRSLVSSSEFIEILKVIGGVSIVPSLAAIIVQWLKNNGSREVLVMVDKDTHKTHVNLKGYSIKDVENIIEKTNEITLIQSKPDGD